MTTTLKTLTIACAFALGVSHAVAAETTNRAAFYFGGVFTNADMFDSALPLAVPYEGNAILGGGYQSFIQDWNGIALGWETGMAARFGKNLTAELWAGPVARFHRFELGQHLSITPSFTAGLSFVTAAQRGRETTQVEKYDGDASVLFYLGPELNFSSDSTQPFEFFWRLHHRSGGGKTLGNMKGAMNANVIGVRFHF